METGTFQSDLKEADIKPTSLVTEYLNLIDEENKNFTSLVDVTCPSCGSPNSLKDELKLSLQYKTCAKCLTIYVSPRPTENSIVDFHLNSRARRFWLENVYKPTAEARKKKILEPMKDWIYNFMAEYVPTKAARLCELNAIHWGFLESWLQDKKSFDFRLMAPRFDLKLAPLQEISKYEASHLDLAKYDGILLIDALNKAFNVKETLNWVHSHMNEGGLAFATVNLSTGLDTLTLGAKTQSLVPPDHLNVFSYEGILGLLKSHNFEILEFSTPGALDLEHLKESMSGMTGTSDASLFFKYLLSRRDPELESELTKFLQRFHLSSKARIVFKRFATTT